MNAAAARGDGHEPSEDAAADVRHVPRLRREDEAARARTDESSPNEGANASREMHDTRSGEVGVTEVGEPAVTPCHRTHHRVDEARHESRENEVAAHLEPLCDAPGHDGGCGHTERPLEEPILAHDQMTWPDPAHLYHRACRRVDHSVSEEIMTAISAEVVESSDNLQRGPAIVGSVVVAKAAVQEGEAAGEPDERAEACVQQILQEDRLARDSPARTRLQQSESGVHEEHERSTIYDPRRTHCRSNLRDHPHIAGNVTVSVVYESIVVELARLVRSQRGIHRLEAALQILELSFQGGFLDRVLLVH